MTFALFSRRSIQTPCTIEIEHTNDSFHAHVVLDGDIEIGPGDKVLVHGQPIVIAFGDKRSERRLATVEPAGALRRAWTLFSARFELAELYEVSFTSRRAL